MLLDKDPISIGKMLFKSRKKAQAEKGRATREEQNLSRGLLRLPAELRNQIFEMIIPTDQDIVKRKIHVSVYLNASSFLRSAILLPFSQALRACDLRLRETYPH